LKSRAFFLILGTWLISLAVAAPASAGPLPLVADRALTFCADLQNPPTGSLKADGHTPEGVGVDLMNAMAGKLGLGVSILNYRASGVFAALDTGKCDAIMASLSRSPERMKRYDFVDYFRISSGFLVAKGHAGRLKSHNDLAGKRIAVLLGSRNEAWLHEEDDTFAAQGLPRMTIVNLGTNVAAFQDLALGRVDALLSDSIIINYYLSHNAGRFEIAPLPARAGTTLAIAVPKAHPEVAHALRGALDALVEEKTVDRIAHHWGIENGVVPCSTQAPCSREPVGPASVSHVPPVHFDLGFFLHFVLHPPPVILSGILVTLGVAMAAQILGTVLGLGLALLALGRSKAMRVATDLYIWAFRSVPVLVQLVIVYFGLPYLVGFDLFPASMGFGVFALPGALVAGTLTFGVHEAAMMSEIIRVAIQAIDSGQTEVARSLGMWPGLTLRRIILPQAARIVLPPLGNQFSNMIKTTSLLSVIGVGELFRVAEDVQAATLMTFEVYLGISVYYLALIAVTTLMQRWIERRLAPRPRRAPMAQEITQ